MILTTSGTATAQANNSNLTNDVFKYLISLIVSSTPPISNSLNQFPCKFAKFIKNIFETTVPSLLIFPAEPVHIYPELFIVNA
jgi:hypothetical protein